MFIAYKKNLNLIEHDDKKIQHTFHFLQHISNDFHYQIFIIHFQWKKYVLKTCILDSIIIIYFQNIVVADKSVIFSCF